MWDEGENRFSVTNMEAVGCATAGVLALGIAVTYIATEEMVLDNTRIGLRLSETVDGTVARVLEG